LKQDSQKSKLETLSKSFPQQRQVKFISFSPKKRGKLIPRVTLLQYHFIHRKLQILKELAKIEARTGLGDPIQFQGNLPIHGAAGKIAFNQTRGCQILGVAVIGTIPAKKITVKTVIE
jgi:hypothetical protein